MNNNNNRQLPKKEADLFKAVVKFYECKQYKKGIKAADNILKKFPNHGETLCMKGLTLNFMNNKTKSEAHEYVRKGLMHDMRSHVCWHVFGLLHRSDRNYNEAIKAYKQALRIDPDNLQILRDLSLLQIQMRDLHGFVKTRHTILTLKPNNKIHWLAFALSKNLIGDNEGALNVIDIYLSTLSDTSPDKNKGFESSELSLYKNTLLSDDDPKVALNHLEECKDLIVDVSAWTMAKAGKELKLGMFENAKDTYKTLIIGRNETENYNIHHGFMCAVLQIKEPPKNTKGTDTISTIKVLTVEERRMIIDAYKSEIEPFVCIKPSSAIKRIPLTLYQGDELRQALDTYCRYNLQRGVPSLGSDLSSLLLRVKDDHDNCLCRVTDPIDIKTHPTFIMITTLVDEYIDSLTSTPSCFHTDDDNIEQPPSTLLWTWYLRAYLYKQSRSYTSALTLLDKCLEHTPTAVDVYELKGRIVKLSGDIQSASDVLDTGRLLDKQDRYINNKTTKYMLQADKVDVARDRIAMFTRHEGNPEQNLFDMQCTWYELELAKCYARTGQWGKSLKKFLAIEKHFEDFNEDQFDFHSYCIRKVTLRAYVDVLRFEDELHTQQYYRAAASGLITNYLHLYDHPDDAVPNNAQPDYSNMTAAQKKKAKAAARRSKQKAQKSNGSSSTNNKKPLTKSQEFVEEDPNGELLLKKDPLNEAMKYTSILSKQAPQYIDTWISTYHVSIRRCKYSMALQALFKAKNIDEHNYDLFKCIFDFVCKLDTMKKENDNDKSTTLNPLVYDTIMKETYETLLQGQTLYEFVNSRMELAKQNQLTDLLTRIAIYQVVRKMIKSSSVASGSMMDDALNLILKDGLYGRKVTCQNCKLAWKCLTEEKDSIVDDSSLNCWREKVIEMFPFIKLE